jgi:uncharacterized membrane protein (UPF0136 family)
VLYFLACIAVGPAFSRARFHPVAPTVDDQQGVPYSVETLVPPARAVMGSLNPIVGQVTLGIYALLLAVGGVIGYFKAGSRPSLIAGTASALVALAALALSVANNRLGVPLGMIVAIALFLLFGYRYAAKTGKFMPSGLLAVVSLIVLAVMFLVMDWTGT